MKRHQKHLFLSLLLLALLAIASSAFARSPVCPVAYVESYVEEEMQDYLDTVDVKDILIEKSTWHSGSTFFLVLPTDVTSTVTLYKAIVTDGGKVLPDYASGPVVAAKSGWALLFRYEPPGSIPQFAVELTDAKGEKYTWFPDFSGRDGKLETSPQFVMLPTSLGN